MHTANFHASIDVFLNDPTASPMKIRVGNSLNIVTNHYDNTRVYRCLKSLYGGEKSLGWKIDYKKLFVYLREKYGVSRTLYFGGVEIHDFSYDYLAHESVQIEKLERYLTDLVSEKGPRMTEAMLLLLNRHLQRVRFYLKLRQFGYELHLKPVKLYEQGDGMMRRKANCDVDMAFWLMKKKANFDRAVILSGDGDFLPVLKHLREQEKEVLILARGPRTAREIRQFAGANFRDFTRLENRLKFEENK